MSKIFSLKKLLKFNIFRKENAEDLEAIFAFDAGFVKN